jgi:mannose-6-phosphate isomerase-like protein (cupin superfamily)
LSRSLKPLYLSFELFIFPKKAENKYRRKMANYSVTRWREIFAPNIATLRFRLTGEGFQTSQWIDQPHAVYGWRKSPLEHAHWVISGSLRITIKDVGSFFLNVGDRDFIPIETYYRIEAVGD